MRPSGEGGRDLFVDHIGALLTLKDGGAEPLGMVRDAAVLILGGRVAFAGPAGDLDRTRVPAQAVRLDASGRLVTPGLVEPHAHPIFAGSRAHELDLRARGKSYLEIQAAGGGIASTVAATRAASDEELVAGVRARLDRFLAAGVTVVESKTGYDLTVPGELRLLGLLEACAKTHPIELSPTLLAHVPPEEERSAWVSAFCDEALPAARGRAEAVDVYCDEGAFTLAETRTILERARSLGFALRVHAEQFTHTGAAELGAELGARSVEHLERFGPKAPAALARAGTVCNLLPGAALTLKLPWPDARRLLAAGCRVALGTDLNPGSSFTESLPLMMSLASMQMGLSSEEAWRAVTVNAAQSVGRADAGRLVPGARGDVVVWDAHDHREVLSHYGTPLAQVVAIRGRVERDVRQ